MVSLFSVGLCALCVTFFYFYFFGFFGRGFFGGRRGGGGGIWVLFEVDAEEFEIGGGVEEEDVGV